MAPYVPLLYGAQVEILQQYGGQILENRLWFVYDNPPFGSTELQGLTDGVASWWTSLVLPGLATELITLAVGARDWSGASPGPYVVTPVSATGGVPGASYSANVSVVVPFRWPIGVAGKKNKNYVCGIPDAGIILNTVQPVFNDWLFEGYAALIDAARLFFPVLNWRWVVTSAIEDYSPRTEQLWYSSNGVQPNLVFKVGQRRKRMP